MGGENEEEDGGAKGCWTSGTFARFGALLVAAGVLPRNVRAPKSVNQRSFPHDSPLQGDSRHS